MLRPEDFLDEYVSDEDQDYAPPEGSENDEVTTSEDDGAEATHSPPVKSESKPSTPTSSLIAGRPKRASALAAPQTWRTKKGEDGGLSDDESEDDEDYIFEGADDEGSHLSSELESSDYGDDADRATFEPSRKRGKCVNGRGEDMSESDENPSFDFFQPAEKPTVGVTLPFPIFTPEFDAFVRDRTKALEDAKTEAEKLTPLLETVQARHGHLKLEFESWRSRIREKKVEADSFMEKAYHVHMGLASVLAQMRGKLNEGEADVRGDPQAATSEAQTSVGAPSKELADSAPVTHHRRTETIRAGEVEVKTEEQHDKLPNLSCISGSQQSSDGGGNSPETVHEAADSAKLGGAGSVSDGPVKTETSNGTLCETVGITRGKRKRGSASAESAPDAGDNVRRSLRRSARTSTASSQNQANPTSNPDFTTDTNSQQLIRPDLIPDFFRALTQSLFSKLGEQ
ncbi:hypothetical protein HK102_013481 [Quaeritorhiza haematococci]|nr:hypothetical protein HK102_013481 [Quaeritorhiza haematococci]